ncbi:hypothetical protein GCM10009721_02200 [Terrabacter tumescens]|uniref:DUF1772 domain-containing protein n=1 Tax=Terrabacter tumescens TaxID=60443 RepID=A0ABQ2HJN6_9MICO|nr:hypothetical protein [Terrabacter tumescens]GGM81318.1 hypothetical protein GCM10009721_02200 [Terrabacter tumescens]
MSVELPVAALAVTAALHAGFQVTVTALVYPPLLGDGSDWSRRHGLHSRRIVPLVVLTYGAVLVSMVWVVAAGAVPASAWVAGGTFALTLLVTAAGAAPLHGRLGRGFDPVVARRLLVVDRWRCALAVLASVAAVVALLQA